MQPLLGLLGELRDFDVAATVTLPELAEAYATGNTQRAAAWEAMVHRLRQAAEQQRDAVRKALLDPAVGATLLADTQWLEGLALRGRLGAPGHPRRVLRRWSLHRVARMQRQLKQARKNIHSPDGHHRVAFLPSGCAMASRRCATAYPGEMPKSSTCRP